MVLGASEISAYRRDRFREVFGRPSPEDLQAGGEGLEVESVVGAVAFFWEWQWSSNQCAVVVVDLAVVPVVAGTFSESPMKTRLATSRSPGCLRRFCRSSDFRASDQHV